MAKSDLTAQRLRNVIHYDPQTGKFTWLIDRTGGTKAGDPAGSLPAPYIIIQIDGTRHRAHRLAWLYVFGHWPTKVIDHIDGDGANNRLSNLRDVEESTNAQNKRAVYKSSKTQVQGVAKSGNRWKAIIRVNGRRLHLGCFGSIEEARSAYIEAKRALHAGCAF